MRALVSRKKEKLSSTKIECLEFPKQDLFVKDANRFIAANCTRRAGKSSGLALRFFRTLTTHPNAFCPYIALTRDSAKNIMWNILQECDERFKIGAVFTESNLTMTLPNSSRLQLFGADMKNFIRRLKGIKTPGVAVDEAQDFGSHLTDLIESVLEPTIADYPTGWIALTGTPGPVPHGYFYEVVQKGHGKYSLHEWSLLDNPYMPNAQSFIDELKEKKGWDDNHPTLRREWYGEWVLDVDALVFKYDEVKNAYQTLPQSNTWHYIVGIDLGFDDSDAIACIGWNDEAPIIYLVEELVTANQEITSLANQIDDFIKRYNPDKIVMDTGGLGKKIAETYQQRYGLPVVAADKHRKFENIEILNDAMRVGKFYAKNNSHFAFDAKRVKWDQDAQLDKPKVDDRFHSDICDAVLYAARETFHWLYEAPKPRLIPNTPEWVKKQEEELESAAYNKYIVVKDIWDQRGLDDF